MQVTVAYSYGRTLLNSKAQWLVLRLKERYRDDADVTVSGGELCGNLPFFGQPSRCAHRSRSIAKCREVSRK